MAADVFEIIQTALRSCVAWTTSLFDSTGMGGIVTAVFILGLIISFFLMPFRGVTVTDGSGFSEFAGTSIHNYKAERKRTLPGRKAGKMLNHDIRRYARMEKRNAKKFSKVR